MRISARKFIFAVAIVVALGAMTKVLGDIDKIDRCAKQYADCLNDPNTQAACDAAYDRCLELALSAF